MPKNVDGRDISVPIRTAAQIAVDGQPDGALAIEKETGKLFTYGSDVGALGVNVESAALGWETYTDTDTEGSPQVLVASQDNIITIDTVGIISQAPNGHRLWNTSTNKIVPFASGDSYTFRLNFKAKIANVSGYFTMKLDIGGSQGVILERASTFPKGANTEQAFSSTNMVFSLDTFLANGGIIKINPSHTMDIYSKTLFIERTYAGQ